MGWMRPSACALLVWGSVIAGRTRGEAILLDFQTDWCGACRIMEPVIHELAAEGYHIRKINGDQEPQLVRQFGIQGYPTFIALDNGREVGRLSGSADKARLRALLDKAGGLARPTTDVAAQNPSRAVRGQSPDNTASLQGWEPAGPPAESLASRTTPHHDLLLAASVRLRIQDANGQSTGSGTIIDARDGEALILTCGHMFREFEEAGRILVEFFGPGASQPLPGTLISYDLNSDVGLVRISGNHRFVAAKVAKPGYSCRPGDAVVSLGCDNGADATPRLTSIVSIDRYQHAPNLQVAFEPVQGRSGGGLFNGQGELIGVCNAADAQDKQGLFAALGAIYAELDRTKLTFVYKTDSATPTSDGLETQLADVASLHNSPPATTDKLSNEERALIDSLRSANGAEVICLVRALDDPQAKSRVFQINRASAAFWRELAGYSSGMPEHKLTSLENRADRRAIPGILDAADSVPVARSKVSMAIDGRSSRTWPPRSAIR
jgi:thiol-disulfide isomerase/thioredoxin